jgi:hypothetical protein
MMQLHFYIGDTGSFRREFEIDEELAIQTMIQGELRRNIRAYVEWWRGLPWYGRLWRRIGLTSAVLLERFYKALL